MAWTSKCTTMGYQITFSRSLIQVVKPSWVFASFLGIPPRLDNYYYLTSQLQQFANTTDLSNNVTQVSIYLQSSVIIKQKEIRLHTVYNAVGSFGGVWTLLAGIYSLAFGGSIVDYVVKNIFSKIKKTDKSDTPSENQKSIDILNNV
ncbi:5066_t:CDS:2 [Dentiscutata heterogama]|uniref:5066_t:CDS:1 n=1 Tax=Dentiscutata heterogama TaxID=1316150 RepID=A0ACA9KPW3_9GLOM|nr:5066_t:CDS:2 [Dentiscutata heterogama]